MDNATIMVTGGTGSFGQAFIEHLLKDPIDKLIIYSRDELKQSEMRLSGLDDPRLRYFIGDVRDKDRLKRAMHGVDTVVHAAALKQVEACEYNINECTATNVYGSQNVVEAAIDSGVKKAILIGTDKACLPINAYGKSKALAESIFIQGNAYASGTKTRFSVTRYGNVIASRGSVIPIFLKQKATRSLTVTHPDMTRFWIELEEAAKFVFQALTDMRGGEIFVPRLPSCRVLDVAKAIAPECSIKYIGIRPGEKLHEVLVSKEESYHTLSQDGRFVILPSHNWFNRGKIDGAKTTGEYASHTNTDWLSVEDIRNLVGGLDENTLLAAKHWQR